MLFYPDKNLLLTPNSQILWRHLSSISFFCSRPCLILKSLPLSIVRVKRALRYQERGGDARPGRTLKSFVRVYAKLFLLAIYCTNTRPKPKYQYSYLSCREFIRRALQIIREYDLATMIAIQPLTQPHTFEMGSSIFATMNWLKFVSTTRASFPSMSSTEITNSENFLRCFWKWLPFF